jgi:hypothetical protein
MVLPQQSQAHLYFVAVVEWVETGPTTHQALCLMQYMVEAMVRQIEPQRDLIKTAPLVQQTLAAVAAARFGTIDLFPAMVALALLQFATLTFFRFRLQSEQG